MPISLTLSCRYKGPAELGGEPQYEIIVRVPRCMPGVGVVKNVDMSAFMQGQDYTGFVYEFGNTTPLAPSKQRVRRSVTKQEITTAESLGGRRQSGSGAKDGHKGDGRVVGKYRIENKMTTAASARVQLKDLQKIRAECQGLEVPVFEIEFREKQTLRTKDKWALVPWSEWEKLANAAGNDH